MDVGIIEHLRKWEKLLVIDRVRRGDEKTVISRGTPDFEEELCFLCENDINSTYMRIISPSLYGYVSNDYEVYCAHHDCFRRIYDKDNSPYEIPYSAPEDMDERIKG